MNKNCVFFCLFLIACGGENSFKENENENRTTERPDCSSYQAGDLPKINYCFKPVGSSRDHVTLIKFHGMGGNEQEPYPDDLIANVNLQKQLISGVLNVSFGPQWSLSQTGKQEALEALLTKLSSEEGVKLDKIIVFGPSMGGHNSLYFTKKRSDRIDVKATAIVCPAVLGWRLTASSVASGAGFSNQAGVHQVAGLELQFVSSMGAYATYERMAYSEQSFLEWLSSSEKVLDLKMQQKLFIHANTNDGWPSFYTGADELRKLLTNAQWFPTEGGHCENLPMEAIAQFFISAL